MRRFRPGHPGLPEVQPELEPRIPENLFRVEPEHGTVTSRAIELRELVEMGCRGGCKDRTRGWAGEGER